MGNTGKVTNEEGSAAGDELSRASLRPHQFLARWDEADEAAQAKLLADIAGEASTGSTSALDVLITVIDKYGLAIPAIRRILADQHAVDEVAQDVLIAVSTSIASFRGDSRFTTWLYAVARNQARLYLRRQTRTRAKDDQQIDERPAHRVSSLIAQRGAVDAALRELPDAYRDAVVLRDVEQYTYEEIATTLAIEMNTVRSRISRGRALVAAAMDVA